MILAQFGCRFGICVPNVWSITGRHLLLNNLTGSRRDIGKIVLAMRLEAQQIGAQRVFALQALLSYAVGAAIPQNSAPFSYRSLPSKGVGRRFVFAVERYKNVQQDADRRLPPGGNPRCRRSR